MPTFSGHHVMKTCSTTTRQRHIAAQTLLRRRASVVSILLALHGAAAMAASPTGAPAEIEYDASFLVGSASQDIDLSRFEHGNVVLPGTYSVDISVVDGWQGRKSVTFKPASDRVSAVPCFDRELLTEMGLDWAKLASSRQSEGKPIDPSSLLKDAPLCGELSSLIPGSSVQYDASQQTMQVSIPQLYLDRKARGWVDPSKWERGINAALLNYNLNTYEANSGGKRDVSTFLGVNAGANIGGWRLRHQGSLQWSTGRRANYQSSVNYAQHDVTALRAQLTIGDTFTDASLFDGSVRVRGVQLASDDRMLPQSLRGFAPVVRGVANTNALVTIRQNGQVILQTTVPAGPFKIDDLYPSGRSGNLDVTIKEADGQIKTFTVPFASLPQLLRPGQSRFSVTAGKSDVMGVHGKPYVAQASWQKGLNNWATSYDGFTSSTGYVAATAGVALNLPIGAVNVDATQAHTSLPGGGVKNGHSLHVGYSSTLTNLGTTFTVGAYRYSSRGYLSLNNALLARNAARQNTTDRFRQELGRLDLNVSQPLGGDRGVIYASGAMTRYWGGGGNTTYSAGYSNQFRNVSFGLQVQRTHDLAQSLPGFSVSARPDQLPNLMSQPRTDTQVMLTVSVPLGTSSGMSLSTNVAYDTHAGVNEQASLMGTLGSDQRFSYGVTAGHQPGNSNYGASGQYLARSVTVGANISHSGGGTQTSMQASGGLVVHRGGVTLTGQMGDTIGLVHADGGEGAAVTGMGGVRLDRHGYAVVPYLTPYQRNTLALDPNGLPLDLELKGGAQDTVPRAGAVVRVDFQTVVGRTALIDAMRADGTPLPFGAEVTDAAGHNLGMVGQGSRIVARGLQDQGELVVAWGDSAADSCTIPYHLPPRKHRKAKTDNDGYQRLEATCSLPHVNASAANPAKETGAPESKADSHAPKKAAFNDSAAWMSAPSILRTTCGVNASYRHTSSYGAMCASLS